jgi:hypothetical protein
MEKLSVDTDVVKLSTAKTAKTTSRQSSDAFRGMMQNISENQNSGKQTDKAVSNGRKKEAKLQKSAGSKGIDEADRMSVMAAQMNMRTKVDSSPADAPEELSLEPVADVQKAADDAVAAVNAEILQAEGETILQDHGQIAGNAAEAPVFREAQTSETRQAFAPDNIRSQISDPQQMVTATEDGIHGEAEQLKAAEATMQPEAAAQGVAVATEMELTVGITEDVEAVGSKSMSVAEEALIRNARIIEADEETTSRDDLKADAVAIPIIDREQELSSEAKNSSAAAVVEADPRMAAKAQVSDRSAEAVKTEPEDNRETGDELPMAAATEQSKVQPEEALRGGNPEHAAADKGDDEEKPEDEIHVLTQDGRIDSQIRTQSQFSEIRSAKETTETAVLKTSPDSLGEDVTSYLKTNLPKQNGSLELILNPENLGRITIRVSYSSGNATIGIQAANPETLRLLTQEAARMGQILRETTGSETKVIVTPPSENASDTETDTEARSQNRREADENQNNKRQKEDSQDRFLNMMRLGMV